MTGTFAYQASGGTSWPDQETRRSGYDENAGVGDDEAGTVEMYRARPGCVQDVVLVDGEGPAPPCYAGPSSWVVRQGVVAPRV